MYEIFNIKVVTGKMNNIILIEKTVNLEVKDIEHYRKMIVVIYKQKIKDKIIDGVINVFFSYKKK